MVGWGAYMRDVSVTGNVVRDSAVSASRVSVVNGAGTAVIAGNLISGTKGAIVGMDHGKAVTGDLSAGADPLRQPADQRQPGALATSRRPISLC